MHPVFCVQSLPAAAPPAPVQDVGVCIAQLAVNNSSYSIIQACFQLWQVVKPTVSIQARNPPSKGKFPKLPVPGCLVIVLHKSSNRHTALKACQLLTNPVSHRQTHGEAKLDRGPIRSFTVTLSHHCRDWNV